MKSFHKVIIDDSRQLEAIETDSVEMILTSPPYPMIEMWDDIFIRMNQSIGDALNGNDAMGAFHLMHAELDKVWRECYRVLKPGCIACINIGDAVRTINGNFRMYSNHSKIVGSMCDIGFVQLPDILWRKQTNAPNKFMGSGMLPSCAYVTYEHEYLLIFRKGEKRKFNSREDKDQRRKSAYYWEERNLWFSDVWTDLKGTSQALCDLSDRKRSAAYPFELAYRLICMHTIYGDTILDPFLGTGTSSAAAVASCRNSIGCDMSKELMNTIHNTMLSSIKIGQEKVFERLVQHMDFIKRRQNSGKVDKYLNKIYNFSTVTSQETDIVLFAPTAINQVSEIGYEADYEFISPEILTKN